MHHMHAHTLFLSSSVTPFPTLLPAMHSPTSRTRTYAGDMQQPGAMHTFKKAPHACSHSLPFLLIQHTLPEHLPTNRTLCQNVSLRTRSYIHTDMPTTLFSSHPTTDTMQTYQHVILNPSVQVKTNLQY